MQKEIDEKKMETEKLQNQLFKENNKYQTNFSLLEEKIDYSSINSLGFHSTKNFEEINKMKKLMMDLKTENHLLYEENSILKIENKKICDMLAQQNSKKLFKNIENKFDAIKMTNQSINEISFQRDHGNKNSAFNYKNVDINNEDLKLDKTKKYRFVKPKN